MRGVNFEFIDSLKNNGTKYLVIFDDSCQEICNTKAFVDFATAGKHRGLSTIYNKHNFFHQSKLGRDVELQNTQIVPFKSPGDVMQVTTLSTVGSWFRTSWLVSTCNVCSPLLICWLICCHAQTIDYVIVQTPDPILQNYISWTGWNSQKFRTMNTQNLSALQMFQSFSHKCKNLFLESCLKGFIRFLFECIINLLKGNLQSVKRHHVEKMQSEVQVRLFFLKRTTWKR